MLEIIIEVLVLEIIVVVTNVRNGDMLIEDTEDNNEKENISLEEMLCRREIISNRLLANIMKILKKEVLPLDDYLN